MGKINGDAARVEMARLRDFSGELRDFNRTYANEAAPIDWALPANG